MLCLRKLWAAHYYEKGGKHSFYTAIVVADSFDQAGFRAEEWGEQKFNGRVSKIKIEKSKKGEVVDAYC